MTHQTSRAGGVTRYLRALGPGLVTGASDDDPSGIATYAQAGSQFRLDLLWSALLTLPLMAGVQEICDRTALATGQGLGELIRRRFGRVARIVVGLLLVALLAANALNIAADLQVIGDSAHLLRAGPGWLWTLLSGGAITALLLTGSFAAIARVFKYLSAALLAYVVELVVVHVPWRSVAVHTVVPHGPRSVGELSMLMALLGTTISPYLFFWQNEDRVEHLREDSPHGGQAPPLRALGRRAAAERKALSRADVFTGMTYSNVVMFAIIVATAATLGRHGGHQLTSAADAAAALRPLAGSLSSTLFSFGVIGAGILAVPVLAGSASAALSGLVGRRWGFGPSPRDAPVFYGLVLVGTFGGTALTLLGVNTITLLVFVALVNGLTAAPFLLVVMLISDSREIMGEEVNKGLARFVGWFTIVLMAGTALTVLALG